MFEKYDINDLFLATIDVYYPDNDMSGLNVGNMLVMGISGYGYTTILRKVGDKYIDLENMHRNISHTRDLNTISYVVNYTEPLSKYYTQNGKKKKTFSRRKALLEARQYYGNIYYNQLLNEEKAKKMSK